MTMTYSERIAQVSTALADPTRREIMEYVLGSDSPLSVRDVARHFSLHANAARMHLDKLVKGGLLKVVRRRGEGGGRPANLYGASGNELELNLPARRYKLLAEVLATGVSGLDTQVSSSVGDEAFRRGREDAMGSSSPLAYLPAGADIRDVSTAWIEEISRRGHRARCVETAAGHIAVSFSSCPFGECSRNYPGLVCEIHRRMEEGILSLCGAYTLEASGKGCTFILHAGEGRHGAKRVERKSSRKAG
jgi:predicted ArsR family transcriptional regulator